MTSQLLEGLCELARFFSVIGLYVKVVTVCIAFVITQLEIRVYAGSEYIEGEGDKIPFAFLSEGPLDRYFAGDVNSSGRSQRWRKTPRYHHLIDSKVIWWIDFRLVKYGYFHCQ